MFQINDENGERMSLVGSLLDFIRDNQDSVFITGRWLNTLSAEVLEDLTLQTEHPTFSNILIAKEAYLAEIRQDKFDFEIKEMLLIYEALKLSIRLELVRRTGLITFEDELSVVPKKTIDFRLTEMGEKVKRSRKNSILQSKI